MSEHCQQTRCIYYDIRAEEYCGASDLEAMEQMVKCPYVEKKSPPSFDAALKKAYTELYELCPTRGAFERIFFAGWDAGKGDKQ